MRNIAIFASGSGSNAQRIIEYFKDHPSISVQLVLTNKSDAYVLQRAANNKIPSIVFNKEQFYQNDDVLNILIQYKVDFLILAGFLWLMPVKMIEKFDRRVINIHPALLPKYGGKGMFGILVHKAVVENKERETGITIHYVNKEYDKGDIIFQAKCKINPEDSPDDVANKIHELEYQHFPVVIERIIMSVGRGSDV